MQWSIYMYLYTHSSLLVIIVAKVRLIMKKEIKMIKNEKIHMEKSGCYIPVKHLKINTSLPESRFNAKSQTYVSKFM